MASEKQMEANRRNALKSTGPHSQEGKARSRMNALRHGFASALATVADARDVHLSEYDEIDAYECVNKVDLARSTILEEIEVLLLDPPSEALHKAVRRLGALQRYAARNLSQIKKHTEKLE